MCDHTAFFRVTPRLGILVEGSYVSEKHTASVFTPSLKTETVKSSETLVATYQTTRK
jgi:hypothetical protein